MRSQVGLPVELEKGSGQTRDLSASGVFFETDESFAPGSPITFSLILGQEAAGEPLRIECAGKIVRIERREGKAGIAVAITAWGSLRSATETPR